MMAPGAIHRSAARWRLRSSWLRPAGAHGAGRGLGCAILLACALPAAAQDIAVGQRILASARLNALAAQRRSAALERQAALAAGAAAAARAGEAAVAGQILTAERSIAVAERRMRAVAALRAAQRARLAARQAPVARLVAGLQMMARRPAALALVQRGSIADVVHVRAVLAGQWPIVHARTAALRRDMQEGVALQRQADRAALMLRRGERDLIAQRRALARLEAGHRRRAQGFIDGAMLEEDRATAMGEDARDIVDLMGRIGAQAEVGRRLAALPGPLLRPPIAGRVAPPAGDASPAVADRPPYRLPVIGRLATGLGELSATGVRARGLTLIPRAGAQVVAPAAGRIMFAGRFRDYGRIVIIDHGGGWTSLVTNLGRLGVRVGDRVDLSGPLGQATAARPAVTVELRRGGRPIDITALVAAG